MVSKLQEILDLASKFVSKHSTLPILENVLIKWNIDTLTLRACDMEKFIEFDIKADIKSDGSITVNAKTFTEIIKSIDDLEVELIIDETNDTIKIKSLSDEFSIKWIPANEYVAVPEVTNNSSMIELNAVDFTKWISKVEYSVTERNFSPVLTWILIKLKKNENFTKLVFVWTDSFRLSEYSVNFDWDSNNLNIIIPKVNISEIKKVAEYFVSKWWNSMKILFSDNLVSFYFDLEFWKILCTSLLIQWNFPDYDNDNIIPKLFNTKVIIDRTQLEKAIRKISILTRDNNYFIEIAINKWNVIVTSWETDLWDAKTLIPASVDWEDLNIWINWKYILDFLRSMEDDKIILNIVNPERPFVLNDKNIENYLCVVRPIIK